MPDLKIYQSSLTLKKHPRWITRHKIIKSKTLFMKTTKQIFILVTIGLLAFSNTTFGQTQEHIITLKCHINRLQENKDPYTVCKFEGQTETDTREFTVTGKVGDSFVWKGEAYSGSDELNITKIKYERGTKIFDKEPNEGTKTVKAIAKFNTKGKDPYTYKISFKINGKRRTYHIDPKVKIVE